MMIRSRFPSTGTSLLFIVCILLCVIRSPADTLHVAVVELQGKNMSQEHASILTDKLQSSLFEYSSWRLMEREQVDRILKEQGFQQTGCTSKSCAVEMGQLIGVDHLITGSVGKLENVYYISIRLIDVTHGEIEKSVDAEIEGGMSTVLRKTIPDLARQLVSTARPGQTETTVHSTVDKPVQKDTTEVLDDEAYYGLSDSDEDQEDKKDVQVDTGPPMNQSTQKKHTRSGFLVGIRAGFGGGGYYIGDTTLDDWSVEVQANSHFGAIAIMPVFPALAVQGEVVFGSRSGGYSVFNEFTVTESVFVYQQQYVKVIPSITVYLPIEYIAPMVTVGPSLSLVTSEAFVEGESLQVVEEVANWGHGSRLDLGIRTEAGITFFIAKSRLITSAGLDVGLVPVLQDGSDGVLEANPLMSMRSLELFLSAAFTFPLW